MDNYFAALMARSLLQREITALKYRLATAKNPGPIHGKITRIEGELQALTIAYPLR